MSVEPKPAYDYTVGGSLESDDPTYVKRQADQDLCHELKSGKFCYVLNSRQMGKSSLPKRRRESPVSSRAGMNRRSPS